MSNSRKILVVLAFLVSVFTVHANDRVDIKEGIALISAGQFDKAELFFQNFVATEHNPPATAYFYLTVANIEQKDYQEAIKYGTKALWLDPALPQVHLQLFIAYSNLQLKQEAHHHLSEAAAVDPDFVTRQGASMIVQHSDLRSAIYFFRVVHQLYPGNILNALNLGKAMLMIGSKDKAESVFAGALVGENRQNDLYQLLSEMYYNTLLMNGKFDVVIESNRVPDAESYEHYYYYRALSHFALGNDQQFTKDAQTYFQSINGEMPVSLRAWATAELAEKS